MRHKQPGLEKRGMPARLLSQKRSIGNAAAVPGYSPLAISEKIKKG